MEYRFYLDATEITQYVLLDSTKVTKGTNGRTLSAALRVKATSTQMALYDLAQFDVARYDAAVALEYLHKTITMTEDDVLVYKASVAGTKIAKITPSQHTYELTLQENSSILGEVLVESETYTSKTNKYIIQDLFTKYLNSVDTTNVSILTTLPTYVIADKSLREVLDDLAKLCNADYWLTADDKLYFQSILNMTDAPGMLTENRLTDGYTVCSIEDIQRDVTQFANRVVVVGGTASDGSQVRAVADDVASQTALGKIVEKKIINREIDSDAVALILAEAELEVRLEEKLYGSFTTETTGFDVGQKLSISLASYGVVGTAVITGIEYKFVTPTKVLYSVTFGPKPNILDVLNSMKKPADTKTTSERVSASSITGTIEGQNIIVDASVIQGTIEGENVSVNAVNIEGVIVSSQVADGIINDLAKFDAAVRPIPIATSAPTLPNTNYPLNSYYYNSTNSNFYKNVGGVWTLSTEGDAVTGKLTFYNLGTIKADKIVGLIAAGSINTITAAQITGQITVTQLAGGITADKITSVSVSSLSGSIVGTQIANATITGSNLANNTITGTQIANATITGTHIANATITGTQIANLTITNNQIENLTITTNKIADLAVTSAKINDLSVTKLTAGTATFTDTVTFVRGSNSVAINGTAVVLTGGGEVAEIRSGGFYVPHGFFSSYLQVGTGAGANFLSPSSGLSIYTGSVLLYAGTSFEMATSATLNLQNTSAWQSALGYSLSSHTHSGVYANASHTHGYSDLTGVAASSHTHGYSDLSGVAAATHSHYLDAVDIAYNANSQTNVGGALNNIFSRLDAHGI